MGEKFKRFIVVCQGVCTTVHHSTRVVCVTDDDKSVCSIATVSVQGAKRDVKTTHELAQLGGITHHVGKGPAELYIYSSSESGKAGRQDPP